MLLKLLKLLMPLLLKTKTMTKEKLAELLEAKKAAYAAIEASVAVYLDAAAYATATAHKADHGDAADATAAAKAAKAAKGAYDASESAYNALIKLAEAMKKSED